MPFKGSCIMAFKTVVLHQLQENLLLSITWQVRTVHNAAFWKKKKKSVVDSFTITVVIRWLRPEFKFPTKIEKASSQRY